MKYKRENKQIIPAADPRLRFDVFRKAILEASGRVLDSGSYILGEEVKDFEKAFAAYIGASYCIAVNSGTDAISLSLLAIGVKPNDEVITTSVTAPATVSAILNIGATPVIVDVASPTYCISPEAVKVAITNKTKAIVPVHLHGYAAPLQKLEQLAQKYNLHIVEDCAQAHGGQYKGKKLGSIGICGAFSFYPTKNLGCMGDGGAITTDDPTIAKKMYSLRNYGINEDGLIVSNGMNSRMDELQAAILNVQLADLDDYNRRRAFYAKAYAVRFREYIDVLPPIIEGSVYHQYPIRVENRDEFRIKLLKSGVATNVHYAHSMKHHPQFEKYCKNIPVAEYVTDLFVSLPIQPEILDVHFEEVVNAVLRVLKEH
jgi:dTDP-3-amino-3,4,6-trideoxy-alpha-D-glucose transaminase